MSYSYADAMIALIGETLANLPTGILTNQVDKPGNKFTTPDDSKWMRLSFVTLGSDDVTPDWNRDEVTFAIDFFYPKDNGTIAQMRDAEDLRVILENKIIGNASTSKATINELGEDGPWYHMQIAQLFTFEGQ